MKKYDNFCAALKNLKELEGCGAMPNARQVLQGRFSQ